MRIQHNIMAMSSYRNYTNNVNAMKSNLEKLSSGYKINRAGDDAAGLAISEKMRAQITGLKQAQSNAKSAINLVQTAEGALQEVQDMLNRMVKLAEQSANGTYDDDVDRNQLQKEFDRLREEIDRIDQSANFNGKPLFGGPGDTTGPDPEGPEGPDDSGLTDADITQPTNAPAYTAGVSTSSETKVEIDFTGVAFAKAGTVSVTVGGKAYDVTVTEDTDAAGFADAFVAAYNAADAGDQISDATAGAFSAAASGGKVTLTSAEKEDVADSDLKTALKAKPTIEPKATPSPDAEEGEETAVKSYTSAVTGDDGTNKLAAGDKITINGKEYTMVATGASGSQVAVDTADDFAKQMKAAIDLYNADAGEDYTAAYADGTMTFTVKEGKTPASAPTFSITDAGSNISAGQVTEVEDPDGPDEPDNPDDPGNTTGHTFNFQVGDTNDQWNKIQVTINSISTSAIVDGNKTTLASLSIADEDSAGEALGSLKEMVNYISDIRGDLGAAQNRLTHTINNLSVMEENIQDAESTIRDTDVADEMMAYTKNNILIQSAQAMLAQANQVPQGVLQLLQ